MNKLYLTSRFPLDLNYFTDFFQVEIRSEGEEEKTNTKENNHNGS